MFLVIAGILVILVYLVVVFAVVLVLSVVVLGILVLLLVLFLLFLTLAFLVAWEVFVTLAMLWTLAFVARELAETEAVAVLSTLGETFASSRQIRYQIFPHFAQSYSNHALEAH